MKRKGRIYPGEIIDTFEKDKKVGKANKFEELEKRLIQCFQKFHFKMKTFFSKSLCWLLMLLLPVLPEFKKLQTD